MLCAWAHLGQIKSLKAHRPKLGELCRASEADLEKCQRILQEYFNKTFPQAAEAAEKYRQAAIAASRPSLDPEKYRHPSPDTVMDGLDSPGAVQNPVDMTGTAPEFCFSPSATRS